MIFEYWFVSYITSVAQTLVMLLILRFWLRGSIGFFQALIVAMVMNWAIMNGDNHFLQTELLRHMAMKDVWIAGSLVFITWLPTVVLVAMLYCKTADWFTSKIHQLFSPRRKI